MLGHAATENASSHILLMENTARYARRVQNSTRDHEGGAGPEGRTRKAVCALLQQSECAGGMKASSACGSPLIGPLASCTPVVRGMAPKEHKRQILEKW
ncbi:MAG: hypothetical protein Q9228_006404 [Teloschistes exilis]